MKSWEWMGWKVGRLWTKTSVFPVLWDVTLETFLYTGEWVGIRNQIDCCQSYLCHYTAVGFGDVCVTSLQSSSQFLLMDNSSIYLKRLIKLNYINVHSKCSISISYYFYSWINGTFSHVTNKPTLLKVFPYPYFCLGLFLKISSSLLGQVFGRVYLNVSIFFIPQIPTLITWLLFSSFMEALHFNIFDNTAVSNASEDFEASFFL